MERVAQVPLSDCQDRTVDRPKDDAGALTSLSASCKTKMTAGHPDALTSSPVRRRLAILVGPAWVAVVALALWLWIGVGFANYDTLYALVWGQQVGRGQLPDYALSLAPTPHPLAELVGLMLSPLGPVASEHAVVVLAYLALGALGYVVFRLGQVWFSAPVGLLAAALLLSREPVLSYGIRGYVDIPFAVLVLTALLVETRRRYSGAPVLWLLAFAGLLRPEAWLFAAGYWLYLARAGARERDELLRLAVIVAMAPLVWAFSDLVVTGNPLWSLTKTRSTAVTLHRTTGLQNVPFTGSRRLGEILRPDGLFAAATGGALSLWLLRDRARLGIAAGLLAVLALALLASVGLPIDTRYVMLPASLLAIFAGVGLFGWHSLSPDHPFRRRWQFLSLLSAVVIVAFIPSQRGRLDHAFHALHSQQRVEHALIALVRAGAIERAGCNPIDATNHRQIPQLALLMQLSPGSLIDTQLHKIESGTYIRPASYKLAQAYVLEPAEVSSAVSPVPPGFSLVARNASWQVYKRCIELGRDH